MENLDNAKNKVLEFAEHHPYALLAIISVLIIIIIVLYMNNRGYMGSAKSKFTGKKKKAGAGDEDELDELIESIHSKQKRRGD